MKRIRTILCILLTAIMVFVYYVATPSKAYADTVALTKSIRAYADGNSFSQDTTLAYSPLVGEDATLRSESGKAFRRADGATEAVLYPFPVHYEADGEWQAIDNTLIPVTDETGKTVSYRTKAGAVTVQFATSLAADELVQYRVAENKYLSWSIDGITDATVAVTQDTTDTTALTDEERDMALRFPEELSSEVLYEDAASGTSVRYVLNSYILSEFITLHEAPTEKVVYTMTLHCVGLEPAVTEDGSVTFVDADGKAQLIMGSPVMDDAAGNTSDSFDVSLTDKATTTTVDADTTVIGGTYTYTIAPDMNWLNSDACAYPVVIDPDIQTTFRTMVQDTYVKQDAPTLNYEERDRLIASPNSTESLILIQNGGLPVLNSGDIILEATLNLSRYNENTSTNCYIDCYEVTSTWVPTSVTWNSKPSYNTAGVAALGVSTLQYGFTAFDITRLVKKWYANTSTNKGVALCAENSSTVFRSSNYNQAYSGHPYFSLIYRNATGLESTWTYFSQSAGRAGTGSVNAFSGNLVWTHSDAAISNGTLPISLSHTYNNNDRLIDIGYGYGWRLNYAQSIKLVSIANRTETAQYYQLIDGDGTRHYYQENTDAGIDADYVNESDLNSTLTLDTTAHTITITDKGDNQMIFACDSAMENGRLTTIADANGNQTLVTYRTTTLTDLQISAIQEKLAGNSTGGQTIALAYTNDRLSSIDVPNGLDVSYTYTGGRLTGIAYADGKSSMYQYAVGGSEVLALTRATNIDGYNLCYSYITNPYRVASVQEYAADTAGQTMSFTYDTNKTIVTDTQSRQTTYLWDDMGQPICVTDSAGHAVYAAYNSAAQTVTQLSAVSKTQSTIVNLLQNHGFEDSSSTPVDWTRSNTSKITIDSGMRKEGRRSLQFAATTTALTATQPVTLQIGTTYTLSAYFSSAAIDGATLSVTNGSSTFTGSAVETGGTEGTDWHIGNVTFTAVSTSATITITVPAGSGTIHVDSVQLEANATPNRYNMLENADFGNGTTAYAVNYTTVNGVVDLSAAAYASAAASHPDQLDDYALCLQSSGDTNTVTQTITVSGVAGDTYSFGAWLQSDDFRTTSQRLYYVNSSGNYTTHMVDMGIKSMTLSFINSSGVVNYSQTTYFSSDTVDWQFASAGAAAPYNYAQIQIKISFIRGRGAVYVDGLQLYRETFSQGYTYDSNGNLDGYTSLLGQENTFDYDDNDNLTSATDALGNVTSYTYDANHNLLTSTSDEGVVTTNTYNAKGQVTTSKVGNSTSYIRAQTTYDSATALATAVTDARGNSVSYGYNSTTRQQTTITDAKGNTATYSYGNAANMLRLASLTSDGTGTVGYTYDTYGKLTRITRSATYYNFTYDDWNRAADTKVGTVTLSTNAYDTYGRLSSVTYGNGFKTVYTYDTLDRVSEIQQGTTSSAVPVYRFVYNAEGDLYALYNFKTDRVSFFEYDHAGRCMASTEKSFTHTTAYAVTAVGAEVSAYAYQYDALNRLSNLTCVVAGGEWDTVYTYDGDSRPLTTMLDNGKVLTNTYDAIGRLTKRRIGLTTNYDTTLTYLAGASGSQTSLPASYQNGSDAAYTYTYDANGNIQTITQGTTVTTYLYDEANQLIRETLYVSANSSSNKTLTYEYDSWGNLTNKRTYSGCISVPSPTNGANVYLTDGDGVPLAGGVFKVYEEYNGTYYYDQTVTANASGYVHVSWSGYNLAIQQTAAPTGYTITNSNLIYLKNRGVQSLHFVNNGASQQALTSRVQYVYGNSAWQDQLTQVKTYTYSGGVETLASTRTLTYDAMGNATFYVGAGCMVWNGKQLTYLELSNNDRMAFSYDENGLRTEKCIENLQTNYYYNGSVLIGMTTGEMGASTIIQRFSYDSSGKVVSVDYSSNGGNTFATYYYLRNGQNDVVKLIDSTGTSVVQYTYDTWGAQTSCTGTLATSLGQNQPFRYRGYVYDTEAGWYYLQSRYYDPSLGRFISSDVLLSTGQGVLGHNAYAYCFNNPTNMRDSSGYVPSFMYRTWTETWTKGEIEGGEHKPDKRYRSICMYNEDGTIIAIEGDKDLTIVQYAPVLVTTIRAEAGISVSNTSMLSIYSEANDYSVAVGAGALQVGASIGIMFIPQDCLDWIANADSVVCGGSVLYFGAEYVIFTDGEHSLHARVYSIGLSFGIPFEFHGETS